MQTAQTDRILDVTRLEPREKHPTIFRLFDELLPGESLTIHNDHDPKPLYYQLLGERGNIFTWQYLEQGPEWWKVKISRRTDDAEDETLGEIAVKDLRKARIFKKYGLDFCCGGKKTVKEACREKGLDITKVEQELQEADQLPETALLAYNDWNLTFLSDFIVNTHHAYVRKTLPELLAYAQKVNRVHGANHPELSEVALIVENLYNEMMAHMVKEEQVLFPYIKALEHASGGHQPLQAAHFGTVKAPVNMMEMEHEVVGQYMARIREITNDYHLPADSCASYNLLYRMLPEFEEDLHLHVHLENNILFPKAILVEKNQLN